MSKITRGFAYTSHFSLIFCCEIPYTETRPWGTTCLPNFKVNIAVWQIWLFDETICAEDIVESDTCGFIPSTLHKLRTKNILILSFYGFLPFLWNAKVVQMVRNLNVNEWHLLFYIPIVVLLQIFNRMKKKTQSIILYIFAVKLNDTHSCRTRNSNLKLLLSFSNALPSKQPKYDAHISKLFCSVHEGHFTLEYANFMVN